MARGDIVIPISTETKAFRQGVEADIIQPLDDAEKALDDLGRSTGLTDAGQDADRLGDKLDDLGRTTGPEDLRRDLDKAGDSLDDVRRDAEKVDTSLDDLGRNHGPDKLEQSMKDAQRETEELKTETQRTADAIEREYKDAYRDAKRASKDFGDEGTGAMGSVREGAGELKQEIGQNLGEAVSSFSGDLTDLSQVGQDTFGGLAATVASVPGFGIPAAIGLAAGAAGWGLLTQNVEGIKERQQEINDLASKMAEMYEQGVNGSIDAMALFGATQDEINSNYDEVKKNAEDWGVTQTVAARAMAGDTAALAIVQQSVNDKGKEWAKVARDMATGSGMSYDKARALTDQEKKLEDQYYSGMDSLDKYTQASKRGQEQAEATASALYEITQQSGKATGKVDDLGNAIWKLPDGTEVVVDAKTHKAYEDLDALEKKKKKALEDHTTVVRIDVDDTNLRQYRPPAVIGDSWVNIRGRNMTWD